MIATEITIGSLIKTNNGEIIKVESISTKRQHRKVGYHKDGDMCHIHYVRLSQCDGIPLTEEILEENGFCKQYFYNGRFLDSHYICDGSFIIDFDDDDRWFAYGNRLAYLDYVHELQHALRLCRLNDLADNFKLKEE